LALFHVPGKNKRSKYLPGKRKNPILMKTKIRNSICGLLVTPLLLACFALLPRVQAAPDPAAIPGGNTRDGAGSLASRTTGINNSAFGTNALNKLTMGNNNAAQGNSALVTLTDGNKNTALGVLALRLNIHGDNNTAVGYKALYNNTSGINVAVGTQALYSNTIGAGNTGLGYQALFSSNTNDNTAIGFQALYFNIGGEANTAVGAGALLRNSVGGGNIALGINAGFSLTGSNNICIGNIGIADDEDTIRIGTGAFQTRTFIAGISGVAVTGATVVVNGSGQLGVAASSERFKDQIKPMDKASEAILALKPVTFHYKQQIDPKGTPQFGLVAEDVEKINPDLVTRDAKGEIYTVRYDQVNAMLLNEFLKEHRKVEEQEATIAQLKQDFQSKFTEQQKQIKALTSGLEKVNNQLELSKPAPQMVGNNQ
jgi:hypothetical protein